MPSIDTLRALAAALTITAAPAVAAAQPPGHAGHDAGHPAPSAAKRDSAATPAPARGVRPLRADSGRAAGDTTHRHHHPAAHDATRHDATRHDATHAEHGAAIATLASRAAFTAPADVAPAPAPSAHAPSSWSHAMWMRDIGRGWQAMGMAQVFPLMTAASPRTEQSLFNTAGLYATQPVIMANVSSPNARLVLRTTLDFEELTQENGELTYGGWGEGFIDARHPHTILHEAMLTANLWDVGGGSLSLSAGKGFAPYGTDDPMGRPAVKFPTNHHLSQILERFTVNAAYLWKGWGIEAGVFGGAEPEDAYDLSNIESFGDSWSARLSRRFGAGEGPFAEWELSTSFARVAESHHGDKETTELMNAAVRHARSYGFGRVYALVEGSRSDPERGGGHWAVLGETQLSLGRAQRHQPYARLEYATRPEYERQGAPGTPGFFRYEHGAHETGATRWLINTVGYGFDASALPVSVRPFVELQHNLVRTARGTVDPRALYGARSFWSVSAGARIFFGGGPMRMGSYGALDPMTAGMRTATHDGHGGAHE